MTHFSIKNPKNRKDRGLDEGKTYAQDNEIS